MSKKLTIIVSLLTILVIVLIFQQVGSKNTQKKFLDNFSQNGSIEEADNFADSKNQNWWLNSGGEFLTSNNVGSTLQGALPAESEWRKLYQKTNPIDTEQGKYPQNIFRLVTREEMKNLEQQVYFNVTNYNLTNSPNRNESNGVLLFNRYLDENNLYYCGLRVDGSFVVKKKEGGNYYLLAESKYLPGNYSPNTSPNLIPKNEWFGLKDKIVSDDTGMTHIEVYFDSGNGQWQKVLEAFDNSKEPKSRAITESGHMGIRTDFMDVKFKNYRSQEITI